MIAFGLSPACVFVSLSLPCFSPFIQEANEEAKRYWCRFNQDEMDEIDIMCDAVSGHDLTGAGGGGGGDDDDDDDE